MDNDGAPTSPLAKRCFIYARVSMDEQRKGFSIPVQLAAGRKYAAEHGLEVAGEFVEDYTGKEYERPELDRMMEALKEGQASAIVVYNLGRWARKLLWQLMLEEEIKELGAEIAYIQSAYADSPEGELHKQIEGSIMEYERKLILRRTMEGKIGRAQAGYPIPGRFKPYGYRYIRGEKKGWFEIDPEEADIVLKIFHWYVYDKIGTVGIAERLTEMGVPTRTDKAGGRKKRLPGVWSPNVIAKMLHNPIYKGDYYWNKTQAGRKLKDASEFIPIQVPAIVSVELWEAAQVQCRQNLKYSPRNTRHEYLFQGRLLCSECRLPLYTRPGAHQTGYYFCKNALARYTPDGRTRRHNGRVMHQINLDQEAWKKIKIALRNPQEFAKNQAAVIDLYEQEKREAGRLLSDLDGELADVEMQERRLADLYTLGQLSKNVLDGLAGELAAKKERIRRRKVLAQDVLNRQAERRARAAETQRFVESLQDRLDNLTFDEKRHVLVMLDIRGIVTIGERPADDEIRLVIGALE